MGQASGVPTKVLLLMLGGVVGKAVTLVRLRQLKNAKLPMLVTLSGIVTLVRLLQLVNALAPMLVTLSGIVTLVRLLQALNA